MRRVAAVMAGGLLLLGACADEPKLADPERRTPTTRSGRAGTSAPDAGGSAGDRSESGDRGGSQQGGTTRQRGDTSAGGGPGGPGGSAVLGDYRAEGDYDNGRHIGHLTSFEDSTLGIDVVRFLRGDEAKEAYAQETGSTDGPPNDYYVQNQSKTVRLLPLDDDVVIRVNTAGGYEPSAPNEGRRVSSATFASYFEDGPVEGLFWITIEGGRVVAIEQQYLP